MDTLYAWLALKLFGLVIPYFVRDLGYDQTTMSIKYEWYMNTQITQASYNLISLIPKVCPVSYNRRNWNKINVMMTMKSQFMTKLNAIMAATSIIARCIPFSVVYLINDGLQLYTFYQENIVEYHFIETRSAWKTYHKYCIFTDCKNAFGHIANDSFLNHLDEIYMHRIQNKQDFVLRRRVGFWTKLMK